MGCEGPREGPGPAADLQDLPAPARELSQEEGVVMAVVVPAVILDQGDPVEVLPDLGHRSCRPGHDGHLSTTRKSGRDPLTHRKPGHNTRSFATDVRIYLPV